MYDNIKIRRGITDDVDAHDERKIEPNGTFESDADMDAELIFSEDNFFDESNSPQNTSVDTDQRNILSYGISIDTSQIASVSTENLGSELEHLDVDVYEHDQFEEGIINQVDTALATAETNFKRNIIHKKIEEIESEIKIVEAEKADIDKIFLAAKHDVSAKNKISFSLVQQSRTKEEYLARLKKKLSDAKNEDVDLQSSKKTEDNSQKSNDIISDSLRLGEITPFDALAQKNKKVTIPKFFVPSKPKKKKTDEDSCTITSEKDDDYIPVSGESEEIEEDFDTENEDKKKKKNIGKKRKSKANENSKYLKAKKGKAKKTIDDGNFSFFKERMQKLAARKKLRDACKRGEVMEDYNSSDFSSSDDSEDDVHVQDEFVLPKRIWDKLYKYQRVCVKWLWQLHCQDVGGIVGDEMGLGKTIELIAFLVGLDYSNKPNVVNKQKYGLGPVLVVCPASVLHHWVAEIHKWWPKFRVGIMHASGSFVGRLETLVKAINNHPGILVTTYESVSINRKELMRYQWNYVILDEGHKIRNPDSKCTLSCKQFDTPHRIILSGTPMQNNLKELWTIFDFVFPGRLGTLPVFTTEFSAPITRGGYATASSVEVQTACRCATILRDTISPYLLRRFKKDVKQLNLPAKSEQVLFCKLTDVQTKMYKDYLRSGEVHQMMMGHLKVFVGLIKLRKICNHPDLTLLKSGTKKKDEFINSLINEKPKDFGCVTKSGKLVVVQGLLKMWKQQGHRVLLFTQSAMMLGILVQFVTSEGYSYLSLEGKSSIGGRHLLVKKFNEDESIFVFVLTTRVGGLGLNLIGANRVIIFDPDWNPSTDTQARERSWRIGQQKDVTIYRLMTIGTIEEKIYHRQIFKQFLTKRVLTNPLQRRFFKENDLYELFTLGDVCPKQRTETGDIFAGTGSQVNFKKMKKNIRNKAKNKDLVATNESLENENLNSIETDTSELNCIDMSELDNSKDGESEPNTSNATIETLSKSSIDTSIINKRNKKKNKREKDAEVEGVPVKNVAKTEIFKKERECDENIQTEDDILFSLYKTAGIHSALKHDQIEHADDPDFVLIEKEAQRVAGEAITRLKASRAECRKNGLKVPTFTGGGHKSNTKKRFGAKNNSVNSSNGDIPKSSSAKSTCQKSSDLSYQKGQKESQIDLSSSSLLARMKNRNSGMINLINSPQSSSPSCSESSEDKLAKDIQEYLAQRIDGSATSDEITSFFKSRLKDGEHVVFKQLLKRFCTLKNSVWTLHPEFL